jgi:hypothetical protein
MPFLGWYFINLYNSMIVTFVILMAWKFFCWNQRERGEELGALLLLILFGSANFVRMHSCPCHSGEDQRVGTKKYILKSSIQKAIVCVLNFLTFQRPVACG